MVSVKISVTVPKEMFKVQAWRNRVMQVQSSKTKPELQKMFRATVAGWKNKPRFYGRKDVAVYHIGMIVHPASERNGEIYALVNAGAPPHPILPKKGFLRFRPGYSASTSPKILSSRANQRFGGYVSSRGITNPPHPGFEAREFDVTIAEQYADTFAKDMQDTFKYAIP